MTTTNEFSYGPSVAAALRNDVATLASRLRDMLSQYVTYRRTLAELRELPVRTLRDLGFERADLDAVARRAAYGS